MFITDIKTQGNIDVPLLWGSHFSEWRKTL